MNFIYEIKLNSNIFHIWIFLQFYSSCNQYHKNMIPLVCQLPLFHRMQYNQTPNRHNIQSMYRLYKMIQGPFAYQNQVKIV